MSAQHLFDALPLWAFFLATIGLIVCTLEIGYRIGRRRRAQSEEKEGPVGTLANAMLGLLAFMLAFTFGIAAARFEARRALILEEANAIGTAYLRAGLLQDPYRSQLKKLFPNYVDSRILTNDPVDVTAAIRKSEGIQAQLWDVANKHVQNISATVIHGLFIQSLNDVIDAHSKRVMAGTYSHLPWSIWAVLYLIVALTMSALGYHAGLADACRSPAVLALVVTLASVLVLIADLDRPRQGLIQTNQQPLLDARAAMESPS